MKKIALAFGLIASLFPLAAFAFPFGGRASIVLNCVYNSTIYVNLGPPRGGEYIWTTGTRTYQFGPPRSAGQWLLGLAAPPYYCIYKVSPLEIYTGIAITMMGSSGPAAPSAPPMTNMDRNLLNTLPASSGSGSGSGSATAGSGSIGHIVISEVYYSVDPEHGKKPQNEWVELYNGSANTIDLSNWILQDGQTSTVLPKGYSLAPQSYVVVAATSTTRLLWNIPKEKFIALSTTTRQMLIGDGLATSSDRLVLRSSGGSILDAISWGTNTTIFAPAPASVPLGHSFARQSLSKDTDTVSDWIDRASPTPGF